MSANRVHAFDDDALGEHDAVGIAERIRRGEVSVQQVAAAAVARAQRVDPSLRAVAHAAYDRPHQPGDSGAPLYGVPTFVKDNTDVVGMPTNHGTAAYQARPVGSDGRYARQFLSTGMTVLGKSRLFFFNDTATTE